MPWDDRPVRYDVHATRRMLQRHLTQADVEQIVRAAAREADGTDWLGFPKFRAFLRTGGRHLQVAFSDRGDHLYVVTVMSREW